MNINPETRGGWIDEIAEMTGAFETESFEWEDGEEEWSGYETEDEVEGERGFRRAMPARGFSRMPNRQAASRFGSTRRPGRPLGQSRPGRPFQPIRQRRRRVILAGGPLTYPVESMPAEPASEFVRWVQSALNQVLNLNLPITGIMDVETRSAVRSFQGKHNLPVDGYVGPDTRSALVAARRGAAGNSAPDQPASADTADQDPDKGTEKEWTEMLHMPSRMRRPGPLTALRKRIVETARQEWSRWNSGGKKFERQPAVRQILQDYWRTGTGVQASPANIASKEWQNTHPWSAAFISWVLRKAGAGQKFRYSAAHAAYIAAAKQNRLANNTNPFKAFRTTEVSVKPGDIVCKSRAGSGATYDNIRVGMKTHCDIVTEVQQGRAVTIGGNVSNSVSKTNITLDADGRVTSPGYFAVIKITGSRP